MQPFSGILEHFVPKATNFGGMQSMNLFSKCDNNVWTFCRFRSFPPSSHYHLPAFFLNLFCSITSYHLCIDRVSVIKQNFFQPMRSLRVSIETCIKGLGCFRRRWRGQPHEEIHFLPSSGHLTSVNCWSQLKGTHSQTLSGPTQLTITVIRRVAKRLNGIFFLQFSEKRWESA